MSEQIDNPWLQAIAALSEDQLLILKKAQNGKQDVLAALERAIQSKLKDQLIGGGKAITNDGKPVVIRDALANMLADVHWIRDILREKPFVDSPALKEVLNAMHHAVLFLITHDADYLKSQMLKDVAWALRRVSQIVTLTTKEDGKQGPSHWFYRKLNNISTSTLPSIMTIIEQVPDKSRWLQDPERYHYRLQTVMKHEYRALQFDKATSKDLLEMLSCRDNVNAAGKYSTNTALLYHPCEITLSEFHPISQVAYLSLKKWLHITSLCFAGENGGRSEAGVYQNEPSGAWLYECEPYVQWACSSSSQILRIHGSPGSGKSTLFDSFITIYNRSRAPSYESPVLASFFCNAGKVDAGQQTVFSILSSLVWQLCVEQGDRGFRAHRAMTRVYDMKVDEAERLSLSAPRSTADNCLEILMEMLETNPMVLAIDAVNELQRDDQRVLAGYLNDLVSHSSNVVKILVTTTDDPVFSHIFSHSSSISLTHDSACEYYAWLEQTFRQLTGIEEQENPDDGIWIHDNLAEICTGTHSSFVDTQMHFTKLEEDGNVDTDHLVLPMSPDRMYSHYFNIILQLDSPIRDAVLAIFAWILFGREPPTSLALCQIASILAPHSDTSIERLGEICRNFIKFENHPDHYAIARHSARQFLRRQPQLQPKQAHTVLASTCLDLCMSPTVWLAGCRPSTQIYDYAVLHWPRHFKEAGEPSALRQQLDRFLFDDSSQYLHGWWQNAENLFGVLNHPFNAALHAELDALSCIKKFNASAFIFAFTYGLVDVIQDHAWTEHDFCDRSTNMWNALHVASRLGHADVVAWYVERNVRSLEWATKDSQTALVIAIRSGHFNVCETLLSYGADSNRRYQDKSMLRWACDSGDERIACLLIEHGAAIPDASEYMDICCAAARANFIDVVDRAKRGYLKYNAFPLYLAETASNYFPRCNEPPSRELWHSTPVRNRPRTLADLLDVIHAASGNIKMVERRAYDDSRDLALTSAAFSGHWSIFKQLDRSPRTTDDISSSVLNAAIIGDHALVAKLIAKRLHAPFHHSFYDVCAPLEVAAYQGNMDMMEHLIQDQRLHDGLGIEDPYPQHDPRAMHTAFTAAICSRRLPVLYKLLQHYSRACLPVLGSTVSIDEQKAEAQCHDRSVPYAHRGRHGRHMPYHHGYSKRCDDIITDATRFDLESAEKTRFILASWSRSYLKDMVRSARVYRQLRHKATPHLLSPDTCIRDGKIAVYHDRDQRDHHELNDDQTDVETDDEEGQDDTKVLPIAMQHPQYQDYTCLRGWILTINDPIATATQNTESIRKGTIEEILSLDNIFGHAQISYITAKDALTPYQADAGLPQSDDSSGLKSYHPAADFDELPHNFKDPTDLLFAAATNAVEVVHSYLLDFDFFGDHPLLLQTALIEAARAGHHKIVQTLLVHERPGLATLKEALFTAAEHDKPQVISEIFHHVPATCERVSIFEDLLDSVLVRSSQGFDLVVTLMEEELPRSFYAPLLNKCIHNAITHGDAASLKQALDRSPRKSTTELRGLLFDACNAQKCEAAKMLYERSSIMYPIDFSPTRLLHAFVVLSRPEAKGLSLLLSTTDADESIATSGSQSHPILTSLPDGACRPDLCSKELLTKYLNISASKCNASSCESLLSAGADPQVDYLLNQDDFEIGHASAAVSNDRIHDVVARTPLRRCLDALRDGDNDDTYRAGYEQIIVALITRSAAPTIDDINELMNIAIRQFDLKSIVAIADSGVKISNVALLLAVEREEIAFSIFAHLIKHDRGMIREYEMKQSLLLACQSILSTSVLYKPFDKYWQIPTPMPGESYTTGTGCLAWYLLRLVAESSEDHERFLAESKLQLLLQSLLLHAVTMRVSDYLDLVIKCGADVNAKLKEESHYTALQLACRVGDEKAAMALLEAGADVNALDSDGLSCVHIATLWRHPRVVECLLQRPDIVVDMSAGKVSGQSVARISGPKLAKLLASQGQDRLSKALQDVACGTQYGENESDRDWAEYDDERGYEPPPGQQPWRWDAENIIDDKQMYKADSRDAVERIIDLMQRQRGWPQFETASKEIIKLAAQRRRVDILASLISELPGRELPGQSDKERLKKELIDDIFTSADIAAVVTLLEARLLSVEQVGEQMVTLFKKACESASDRPHFETLLDYLRFEEPGLQYPIPEPLPANSKEVLLIWLDYWTCTTKVFVEACIRGYDKVVRRGLEQGISPNIADEDGRPALHFAAAYGRADVVDALLEAGDIDRSDHSEFGSPIRTAIEGCLLPKLIKLDALDDAGKAYAGRLARRPWTEISPAEGPMLNFDHVYQAVNSVLSLTNAGFEIPMEAGPLGSTHDMIIRCDGKGAKYVQRAFAGYLKCVDARHEELYTDRARPREMLLEACRSGDIVAVRMSSYDQAEPHAMLAAECEALTICLQNLYSSDNFVQDRTIDDDPYTAALWSKGKWATIILTLLQDAMAHVTEEDMLMASLIPDHDVRYEIMQMMRKARDDPFSESVIVTLLSREAEPSRFITPMLADRWIGDVTNGMIAVAQHDAWIVRRLLRYDTNFVVNVETIDEMLSSNDPFNASSMTVMLEHDVNVRPTERQVCEMLRRMGDTLDEGLLRMLFDRMLKVELSKEMVSSCEDIDTLVRVYSDCKSGGPTKSIQDIQPRLDARAVAELKRLQAENGDSEVLDQDQDEQTACEGSSTSEHSWVEIGDQGEEVENV